MQSFPKLIMASIQGPIRLLRLPYTLQCPVLIQHPQTQAKQQKAGQSTGLFSQIQIPL